MLLGSSRYRTGAGGGMKRHAVVVAAVCVWSVAVARTQTTVSFEKDVRPILQTSCETCHGELQVSGLDLRTRESALKGGDGGAAIVPGRADQSRLYRRV